MEGKRGSECLLKSVSNIDFNPTKEQYEKDSTSLQDRVSDATDKTKEAVSKGANKSKETLSDSVDKVTSDNKSSRVN